MRRVEPICRFTRYRGRLHGYRLARWTSSEALPALRVLHRTARRALVTSQQMEVDLRIVAPDEFGTALHVATGSRQHLAAMRSRQGSPRLYGGEADVYADAGLS